MAASQKGTTLMIAFGSCVYTGYIPENLEVSFPDQNEKIIRGKDGETHTKLLMDPSQRVTGSFIILGATGSIVPPIQGATVTLTPPVGTSVLYYCVSGSVAFTAEETKLNLDLIKETSMTYV